MPTLTQPSFKEENYQLPLFGKFVVKAEYGYATDAHGSRLAPTLALEFNDGSLLIVNGDRELHLACSAPGQNITDWVG